MSALFDPKYLIIEQYENYRITQKTFDSMGCYDEVLQSYLEQAIIYHLSIWLETPNHKFSVRGYFIASTHDDNHNIIFKLASFILPNTQYQSSIDYITPLYEAVVSQVYYDANFQILHWVLIPTLDGYVSILSPLKYERYYIATFYVKPQMCPCITAPIEPYFAIAK